MRAEARPVSSRVEFALKPADNGAPRLQVCRVPRDRRRDTFSRSAGRSRIAPAQCTMVVARAFCRRAAGRDVRRGVAAASDRSDGDRSQAGGRIQADSFRSREVDDLVPFIQKCPGGRRQKPMPELAPVIANSICAIFGLHWRPPLRKELQGGQRGPRSSGGQFFFSVMTIPSPPAPAGDARRRPRRLPADRLDISEVHEGAAQNDDFHLQIIPTFDAGRLQDVLGTNSDEALRVGFSDCAAAQCEA